MPSGVAALSMVSGDALRDLVDMESAIVAVRGAFVESSRGTIEQPLRMALAGGRSLVMAAADASGDFAVKAVTVFPQNSGRLPVVQGVMFLFDGVTGSPQIGLDGSTLTALRTGAASGVATDLLATPDAGVLAVIGAGAQSLDQVQAVCAVRPIERVHIASRTTAAAERLAERTRSLLPQVRVEVHADPRRAVRDAQVVCTATTSMEPVIGRDDVRDDVHVNAVGAHTADAAELAPDLIAAAQILAVDAKESARAEAGDLIRAEAAGLFTWSSARELGALILDPPARSGVTIFKSVGIAAQDLAVGRLALQRI